MHFISFSYLIALIGTSSTILHKSGMSGHLCLVTDLRRKAFNRSPLFAEDLYYPSMLILLSVLIMNAGLCQMLALHLLIELYHFYLILLM